MEIYDFCNRSSRVGVKWARKNMFDASTHLSLFLRDLVENFLPFIEISRGRVFRCIKKFHHWNNRNNIIMYCVPQFHASPLLVIPTAFWMHHTISFCSMLVAHEYSCLVAKWNNYNLDSKQQWIFTQRSVFTFWRFCLLMHDFRNYSAIILLKQNEMKCNVMNV